MDPELRASGGLRGAEYTIDCFNLSHQRDGEGSGDLIDPGFRASGGLRGLNIP